MKFVLRKNTVKLRVVWKCTQEEKNKSLFVDLYLLRMKLTHFQSTCKAPVACFGRYRMNVHLEEPILKADTLTIPEYRKPIKYIRTHSLRKAQPVLCPDIFFII